MCIARCNFPARPSCVALATSKSLRLVSQRVLWCLAILCNCVRTCASFSSHFTQSAFVEQPLIRSVGRMVAVSARRSAQQSSL